MRKNVFFNFLKDRFHLICFYLFNTLCLITFFYLINEHVEILYPLILSLFVFILYLLIDFYKYYEMNKGMELLLFDKATELKPRTEEQRIFFRLLEKQKKEHSKKYSDLKNHYDESIYFLSHFMHHLKTPVAIIDLILENEFNKNPELSQKIQRENKRIYNSIEQGLTMLRLDHIENDLEIRSIDLLSTLRKIINERKKECIYHTIFPNIDCNQEKVYIATDSKWNDILLNQIISNAIKYSSVKKGKKKLLLNVGQDGKCTTLSIIDEGIGIPPYDLDRIFEPFFTGENGRKYSNSTGIGLYLCKKIADRLGHTITVESNGNGTAVHIRYSNANEFMMRK